LASYCLDAKLIALPRVVFENIFNTFNKNEKLKLKIAIDPKLIKIKKNNTHNKNKNIK